jgi:hypothetical protein
MKTYKALYMRASINVEARTPLEAQFKAGLAFGVPGRLQFLVKVKRA